VELILEATMTTDPVCGMQVDEALAPARSSHEGQSYFFCSKSCKTKFDADPSRYASDPEPARTGRS
jgi:Cu+-exporting ATPase